jgi:hypothetical protein
MCNFGNELVRKKKAPHLPVVREMRGWGKDIKRHTASEWMSVPCIGDIISVAVELCWDVI